MKIWLPVFTALALILGVGMVVVSHLTPAPAKIPFPPPLPPYLNFIATVGVVESSSEDIYVGTPISEIVEKVYVTGGDFVAKGDPLFTLNTDVLKAQLSEAQAALNVAIASYRKQLDLPRPEEIPIQEALVGQAEAHFSDCQAQYQLVQHLRDPRAISQDEFNKRKFGSLYAKYQLEEAEARLNLLLAGAWAKDLDIYRWQKKQAERAVGVIEEKIKRSTICAPLSGVVLKTNISEGEYAIAGTTNTPLLVFGVLDPLYVRVQIDEEEIWRFIKGAEGMAYIRGNSNLSIPIKYVRFDPCFIPKQTLAGDTTEKVDTRILEIIYEFEKTDMPLYPGQMVDVYLQAKPNKLSSE